ncbi:MAG: ABC transporter permease [Gemmatimonadota bacterium]|nr:MAG: ABC transporter permease [Gemmatimonadota bacterium]
MFHNHLRVAFRILLKNKVFSSINISGLAIGIACCILISLWIQDELSYDGFHEHKENIFRVVTVFRNDGTEVYGEQTPAPLAFTLKNTFPEIEKSTTVCGSWVTGNLRTTIAVGDNSFYTDNLILTDSSFFEIFSFPFLYGEKATALSDPNTVVLTSSVANRCFGDVDPLNKTIHIDGNPVIVSGIIEDIPDNSHLQFDVVLPLTHVRNTDRGFFLNKWDSYGFSTYVLLRGGTPVRELDAKIDDLIIKNDPFFGATAGHIFLQSLSRIRLFNVDGSAGLARYVYIFATIAVIVLLIACINYMNLSTARSEKRSKEIGLRKVVGSRRTLIIRQFFSESFLYAFISFLISLGIVIIFLPHFNELTGKRIDFTIMNPGLIVGAILAALFTGIVSGSYPALYLSSFLPIDIFKKSTHSGIGKSLVRKSLVVLQFTLSIALIICMMIVSHQVGFMRHAEIGFSKENIITLPVNGSIENRLESFRHELKKNPNILDVAFKSSSSLRSGATSGTISWEGKDPDLQINWCHPMVDHDYFHTLNMKIVEGRDFSRDNQSDQKQGFILNEEAVRQSGLQQPVGKSISVNGRTGIIIGVVQNAQLNSLRFQVQPEVYHLSQTFREKFQTLFIKLGSAENNTKFSSLRTLLTHIEHVWKQFMPGAPFEYRFLDETIEDLYRAEMRVSGILNYFTLLAVFLSCLGLYGLTSFMAEQRRKEIGVRKVLGASIPGIVIAFSREFTKWVFLANIIAWPLAYYVMNRWLENFSYRVKLGIETFLLAAFLALTVALLTVSYQSLKAALANPVESLRYE